MYWLVVLTELGIGVALIFGIATWHRNAVKRKVAQQVADVNSTTAAVFFILFRLAVAAFGLFAVEAERFTTLSVPVVALDDYFDSERKGRVAQDRPRGQGFSRAPNGSCASTRRNWCSSARTDICC